VRIIFIHPNYRSSGAEIASNWPPAWAAYLTGALKANGYDDIRFIDAMTDKISDGALRAMLADERPDIVNFVTPIMKPAAMERGELLHRVMNKPVRDRLAALTGS
jgi:anaerobic magnesium-protoporphyrin IX monomethyl ester cyclase